MDSDVALHSDGDGHEDRGRHHDHLAGVQEQGEHEGVEVRGKVERFPKTFQDASKQISRIKQCQGDQKKVEGISHILKVQAIENVVKAVPRCSRFSVPQELDCRWSKIK